MLEATLTTNGRITLLKEVRKVLNLQKGERIDFVANRNGQFILKKVKNIERIKALTLKNL